MTPSLLALTDYRSFADDILSLTELQMGQEKISAYRSTIKMPKFSAVYSCANWSSLEKDR